MKVIALDRSHAKVSDIRKLVESLDLKTVRAIKFDATTLGHPPKSNPQDKLGPKGGASLKEPSPKELARMERKRANAAKRGTEVSAKKARLRPEVEPSSDGELCLGSFDRVLLDAPCSALGLR